MPKSLTPIGLIAITLLAGCASEPDGVDIAHVHGVAYDPSNGRLFLATHHGLARGEPAGPEWTWTYVGDRFDYMGFTQDAVASGTFYSSGHPNDPRAFGGVHLGLRRSTDGGETWEQRSLKGQVDFHALTAIFGSEGHLVGGWQGQLKVSRDAGLNWTDFAGPPATVIALASSPGRILAGTTEGLFETQDTAGFSGWNRLAGPSNGIVSSVASSRDGQYLLAGTGDGRSGATFRSADHGQTWIRIESPALAASAAPALFTFDALDASHAFTALADGSVFESRDAGATWNQRR